MRKNLHFAAAFSMALLVLPTDVFANPGTASSSASGFSWFANAPAPATAQARANARARLVINTTRTWICSPAGFGKRSTCVSG